MSDQVDKGWKSILPSTIWKKNNENDSSIANSSFATSSIRFKKKLISRSISKLSLNNLFNSGTPHHSASVIDLKQLKSLDTSPKARLSFRMKACEFISRTPLKKEPLSYSLTPFPKNNSIVRRHSSKLWIETIDKEALMRLQKKLSDKEMARQEAIFELLQGEKDLIDDVLLIENNYHRPLINLKILSIIEGKKLFDPIQTLLPVHRFLVAKLLDCQDQDGIFSLVGPAILEWVGELIIYRDYCYQQFLVSDFLDDLRKKNLKFEDFLQRCLQSPFSRRLDLKTLMDNPRLRLMKYPLLLKSIQNYTQLDSSDFQILEGAINRVTTIVSSVDEKIGEAHCHSVISKLDYDKGNEFSQVIITAKSIHCSGFLKNGRGSKLYCILFNTGFVVARPNHDCTIYLLYRKPIPIHSLCYETRENIKIGSNNSLPRTTSNGSNWFRVYSCTSDISFILLANDEHSRKQWLTCLDKFCLIHPVMGISPRKRPSRISEDYSSPKRNKFSNLL